MISVFISIVEQRWRMPRKSRSTGVYPGGAFVCNKLQSLYMGRPASTKLRDANASLQLNDIVEENELMGALL
jgi:hypothetical protein